MKYSGIKTTGNLRFIKCPVCGNDEFSEEAAYCRICGSAIYNYCQDLYDDNGYRLSTGCGRANPGNSRFCEYCGNPTILHKYLSNWEEERLSKHGMKPEDDLNIELDNLYVSNEEAYRQPNDDLVIEIFDGQKQENIKGKKENFKDDLDIFEEIASSSPDDLSDTFSKLVDIDEEKPHKNNKKESKKDRKN